MPKKRIPKTKLGRTHLHQKTYWLKDNYMKCGLLAEDVILGRYDISRYQLDVLLFVYDLQFFYLPYIAEMLMSQGVRRTSYMEKFVEPLIEKEYLQVVDRGSDDERHFFKENFRNRRFMITARARQLVQDYYNVLQNLNRKYGVGVTPPQDTSPS